MERKIGIERGLYQPGEMNVHDEEMEGHHARQLL
jgi:hypothetical protein